MLTMNRATLVGFAGRNPEMRKLPSGDDVAQFSLATTERFRRKDDTVGESTQWHTIVAYGPAAEVVRKLVRKGDPVLVEGRIATRSWEDNAGNERRSIEIVVAGRGSVVNVLTKRKTGGNGGDGDPPGGAAPAAVGTAGVDRTADAEAAAVAPAASAVPGETAPAAAAEVQNGAATEAAYAAAETGGNIGAEAAVAGDAATPTAEAAGEVSSTEAADPSPAGETAATAGEPVVQPGNEVAPAGEADATAVGAGPPAAPAPQNPARSGNDPADHE